MEEQLNPILLNSKRNVLRVIKRAHDKLSNETYLRLIMALDFFTSNGRMHCGFTNNMLWRYVGELDAPKDI